MNDTVTDNLVSQMAPYRDCMTEARSRLIIASDLAAQFVKAESVTEFNIELIALHIRKLIELIALASIAANKHEYSKIREKFHRDWNAKSIFRDIEAINPGFFPDPFDMSDPKTMINPTYPCIGKLATIDLYERVSKYLHARNRYSNRIPHMSDLKSFARSIELLRNLLKHFEVALLPSRYVYMVCVDCDTVPGILVALAETRSNDSPEVEVP